MDSNNNSANMKLEPGMMCLVIGAELNTDNIGKVVTLVRAVGKGEIVDELGCRTGRDFWLIEGESLTYNTTSKSTGEISFFVGRIGLSLEHNLMPIRPEEDPLGMSIQSIEDYLDSKQREKA